MKKNFWKKISAVILSCLMMVAVLFTMGACGGGDEEVDFTKMTYVAFGDSITWGEVGATQEQMEKPYPVLVKEEMGFDKVGNYGQRNASIKYMESKPNVLTQVASATAKADVVSVLIGINDFGAGCKLGEQTDTSCTESVYGGFNQLAETLKEKYPDAFIFIMTPLQPVGWNETNNAGYTLRDMAAVISQVCEANGFAMLDLNATSQFSSETDPHCPDGLHPSQYFFTNYMAPQIAQFIKDNYNK